MKWLTLETRLISEVCVSMKKEVKDLHETLGKFTNGKEKLDLIL